MPVLASYNDFAAIPCDVAAAKFDVAGAGLAGNATQFGREMLTRTSQNAVLVTGGEDSKLNVWSLEGPTVDDGDDAMELDEGVDAANHTHDASYRGRKRGASWDDGDEMVS